MQVKSIINYPVNLIKRTWLGDIAKLVRIAFTPIGERADSFVHRGHPVSVQEIKQGITGVITPKDVRMMRKKIAMHDFRA